MLSENNSNSMTRSSLIHRARDSEDQTAWVEFVNHYGPVVIKWCRGWCKQDADVHDLTQEIMLKVWKELPGFHYDRDRSFRGWLRTLSRRAFIDAVRSRRAETYGDELIAQKLDEQAQEFARSIEDAYDDELLQKAMVQLQPQFADWQWKAFEATQLGQAKVAVVAEQMGHTAASIYMSNSRIRGEIRRVVSELEEMY